MPMLFELGGAGGVRAGTRIPGTAAPSPQTASDAAFGPSLSARRPSRRAALAPNDAAGITFWAGVSSIGLLCLIYVSLPE